MPLIAQVLTSAALAGRIQNPIAAFIVGIIISIIVDLIPHHQSKILSLVPFIDHFKKTQYKVYVIWIIDILLSVIIGVIISMHIDQFVTSELLGPATKTSVIFAILGAVFIPVLILPFQIFGKSRFSQKLFDFKSKLMFHDAGWSGYLVEIALVIVSIVLITQVLQTPFGTI